jgi:formylglycine-generating enzyme required for sulfatase activity
MGVSGVSIDGDVNGSVLINGSGNHVTYHVIHTADLSQHIDQALSVFVSSNASQQAEREAVLEAVKQMCGLSLPRMLNREPSDRRNPKDVEECLRNSDIYIWFAGPPLGDARETEYQKACEIGFRNRFIFCSPQVQVVLSAAFAEPEENFISYSDVAVLPELITHRLLKFILDQARANNNHYQLSRADLSLLLGLAEAIQLDGRWLSDLRKWFEGWKPYDVQPKTVLERKTTWVRKDEEIETVLVPAGDFWMGSTDLDKEAWDGEKPYHQVYLDEFLISKYPVTVAQFARFVEADGHITYAEKQKSFYTWRTPRGKDSSTTGKENHPVVNVSWNDAVAYCVWLSKATGKRYTLPREAQWEKAARGTEGRIYPWGNQVPDKTRCNIDHWFDGTTPVGYFGRAGESPYGCADMIGNVWEWCADWWQEDYYRHAPRRNPQGPDTGTTHTRRGGSWDVSRWLARCSYRLGNDPVYYSYNIGFRPVLSLADSGS